MAYTSSSSESFFQQAESLEEEVESLTSERPGANEARSKEIVDRYRAIGPEAQSAFPTLFDMMERNVLPRAAAWAH